MNTEAVPVEEPLPVLAAEAGEEVEPQTASVAAAASERDRRRVRGVVTRGG